MTRMRAHVRCALWTAIACLAAGISARAQWVNYPTAEAPRTPDGKVDMTAPAPMLNGKPDLS